MRLYFLRHGDAEHTMGITDHDRNLTAKGVRRTKNAARVIKFLNIHPTVIYSSPRVRARQTAEIVAEALGKNVEISDEVNFGFSIQAVLSLIQGMPDNAEVMFVGHEPSMSMVVGALSGADIDMKKGGLARIDIMNATSPQGLLIWLIAPKVFDAIVNVGEAP